MKNLKRKCFPCHIPSSLRQNEKLSKEMFFIIDVVLSVCEVFVSSREETGMFFPSWILIKLQKPIVLTSITLAKP